MPAKDSKYQTIEEAAWHMALKAELMNRAGW